MQKTAALTPRLHRIARQTRRQTSLLRRQVRIAAASTSWKISKRTLSASPGAGGIVRKTRIFESATSRAMGLAESPGAGIAGKIVDRMCDLAARGCDE